MELSFAAYSCEWFNLNANEVHDLMFIMKRSQNPLKITAGKFVPLSANLFADVSLNILIMVQFDSFVYFFQIAKSSFSYLSVLLAVKERKYWTSTIKNIIIIELEFSIVYVYNFVHTNFCKLFFNKNFNKYAENTYFFEII